MEEEGEDSEDCKTLATETFKTVSGQAEGWPEKLEKKAEALAKATLDGVPAIVKYKKQISVDVRSSLTRTLHGSI